jgi:hypothetical protein
MVRLSSFVLAAAPAALLLATFPASATPVTEDVTFSVTGFTSFYGQLPTEDPVTGSFTITYDPTQSYTDDTADITSTGLNIALDSALSFTYYDSTSTPPAGFSPDELVVGGVAAAGCDGGTFTGSECFQVSPATNDFTLQIDTFSVTPTFVFLGYSQTGDGTGAEWYTTSTTDDSVSAEPVVPAPAVPEPASLALFGTALVGLGAVRWRNRKSA